MNPYGFPPYPPMLRSPYPMVPMMPMQPMPGVPLVPGVMPMQAVPIRQIVPVNQAPSSNNTTTSETTTVYVGKIPKTTTDDLIRKLLECCGKLVNWNRITNPISGEFYGFGYAKFASSADVSTALRILNSTPIQGQNLLLKVDEKTKAIIDSYDKEYWREDTQEKDKQIMEKISHLLSDANNMVVDEDDLDKEDPTMKTVPSVAGDKEKASIVTGEIKKFRESQAKAEKEKQDKQKKVLATLLEADKEKEKRFEREASRMREERQRDFEREQRRKEREEREYRDRERRWEQRERDKEKDIEKFELHQKARAEDRTLIIEKELNSTETWVRHVKDTYRKRDRIREYEQDQMEFERERLQKIREQEELERQIQLEKERKSGFQFIEHDVSELDSQKPSQSKLSDVAPVKLGFISNKKRNRLASGFMDDNPENIEEPAEKKRILVKLDYAEAGLNAEDQKKKTELDASLAKSIAEKIPVEKEALFAYPIKWDIIDQEHVIDSKVTPWVKNKVLDYCGPNAAEEASDLEAFIISQLKEHCAPAQLFEGLQLALGSETELFVKLLWRLLIFHMMSLDPNLA